VIYTKISIKASACEAVRRALERERKELEAAAIHLPVNADGTKVHKRRNEALAAESCTELLASLKVGEEH
jgi:hypothetical protein